jgi:hypothetical protein
MTERPAIIRISEAVDGDDARVMITLEWADTAFHGEAIGSAAVEHRARLVGEATLNAVQKVTDGRLHLDLEAVATQDLGIVQVALAQVNLTETGESLVGSALVSEHDPSAATVKAILDAINRRITAVL